jgi:CDP-diacylglycerol---glycerol-3-phosphate 3-phosphatidyltransferase
MNIANTLTLFRILAIPVLVVILLSDFRGREIIGTAVFVLAALTDFFDGYIARLKNQTTVIGQLLDPTADKLLIASSLICLVDRGVLPAWIAIVIIGREIAVTGFRSIASSLGVSIPAEWPGKVKMQLETWSIALLILGPKILGGLYIVAEIGIWLAMTAAILSAVHYGIRFGRIVLSRDVPQ